MCSLKQSDVGGGHSLFGTIKRETDIPIPNRTLVLLDPVKVFKDGKVGIIGTDHSHYLMNRDVA